MPVSSQAAHTLGCVFARTIIKISSRMAGALLLLLLTETKYFGLLLLLLGEERQCAGVCGSGVCRVGAAGRGGCLSPGSRTHIADRPPPPRHLRPATQPLLGPKVGWAGRGLSGRLHIHQQEAGRGGSLLDQTLEEERIRGDRSQKTQKKEINLLEFNFTPIFSCKAVILSSRDQICDFLMVIYSIR